MKLLKKEIKALKKSSSKYISPNTHEIIIRDKANDDCHSNCAGSCKGSCAGLCGDDGCGAMCKAEVSHL